MGNKGNTVNTDFFAYELRKLQIDEQASTNNGAWTLGLSNVKKQILNQNSPTKARTDRVSTRIPATAQKSRII